MFEYRPKTHHLYAELPIRNSAHTLAIPVGEANEPLNEAGVDLQTAIEAIADQYHAAAVNLSEYHRLVTPVVAAIGRRKSVGAVLANRIYKD